MEKKIFKYFQYSFTFSQLSPHGKGRDPSFEQTRIPFIQGCFVPSKVELAQWFWRRRFLDILNMILHFRYYLPFEKGVTLHLNNLETPLTKDAVCQDWFKQGQWFWRRRFSNILNRNSLFRYYLPLEKGVDLNLNKLESPPPKDAFYQVWLKLAQWFWRRRLLNIFI